MIRWSINNLCAICWCSSGINLSFCHLKKSHFYAHFSQILQVAIAADFHIIPFNSHVHCAYSSWCIFSAQLCHMFNNFLCLENMRHAQWITGNEQYRRRQIFFLCALSHSLRRLNRFGFSRLARRARKVLVSEFNLIFLKKHQKSIKNREKMNQKCFFKHKK